MEYKIKKQIGQGTFGIVEEATDENGDSCAIKTLNLGAFTKEQAGDLKKRFEREVRYQAQIDHPNVVEIIGHNLEDKKPWFVMPLADGSLKDDLEADRTLGGNPQKALFDILSGLEALHNKGFKHRDLKPLNSFAPQTPERPIQYQWGGLFVRADNLRFFMDSILVAVRGQNVVFRWSRMPAIYKGVCRLTRLCSPGPPSWKNSTSTRRFRSLP